MYEVCVIPEKGASALVLNTVYETSFPTDSHVMVAVVNVLELFTCTKCEGAAGDPVTIIGCSSGYCCAWERCIQKHKHFYIHLDMVTHA